MGALFLCLKQSRPDLKAVMGHFTIKGLEQSYSGDSGAYSVLVRKKMFISLPNYATDDASSLFASGSFFYKGFSYARSMKELLADFGSNTISLPDLYGNYMLIFQSIETGRITLVADPSFIKNIWFDPDRKVISTDFLSILAAFPGSYKVNTIALAENIATGFLIPPDTYASGIFRLDSKNIETLPDHFPGLIIMKAGPVASNLFGNFTEAVDDANNRLHSWFRSATALTQEYGASIGLTGGFDSRLLLMHALGNQSPLSGFSIWRKYSRDYIYAQQIAKYAGVQFWTWENKNFVRPPFDEIMKTSFLFFDGQVRSQNYWDEEFSLPEYIQSLTGGNMVGLHGCGGEQYRNADRVGMKTSLSSFVKNEWLFRQNRNTFNDRKLENEVFLNIRNKITRLTGIEVNNSIDLYMFKKIQNEVWNISGRNLRINALNSLHLCFAPFTEYQISLPAYDYVPYLGSSFKFEISMMRRLNPEIGSVKLNYGFSVAEGEPMLSGMMAYMASLMPRTLMYNLYYTFRPNKNTAEKYDATFLFPGNLHNKLNIKSLAGNRVLGKTLPAFSLMLKRTGLLQAT